MENMEKIVAMTDEMLEKMARLVRYPSVRGEATEGKPFGEESAAALGEGLKIAEEMGFRTRNMENYCGYAEMGEGEDVVCIAAHVDVVPAGEGWNTDPFTLTRDGDMVYGRGVNDDKGAVIAVLYAMDLVRQSGEPLRKRVRLVMGCGEETGSECMKYYVAREGAPACGFTPDGKFPCIFGEKGMTTMAAHSKHTKLLGMEGGLVTNAVCSRCVTKVSAADVDAERLRAALAASALPSFTLTVEDGVLTIDAVGLAAHASTPLRGVNAVGCTMAALAEAGMEDDFVTFYNERIGTECDGAGMGLKLQDEYGALTVCNGTVKTEGGVITCTLDLRTPVTCSEAQLRAACEGKLEDERGCIEFTSIGKPLFYPTDSPLVRELTRAYAEVTGDRETPPLVIGGGTYAKFIPGIIAFGCEFPGRDNHVHNANESLYIPELQQQVAIYARGIANLLRS